MLGNEVVGYQVIVNRLEQRASSREVTQSGVYDEFIEMKDASLGGLGKEYTIKRKLCFIFVTVC